MSHFFSIHTGHLTGRADRIAGRHGAIHKNVTDELSGRRYGYFECPGRGDPYDRDTANAVMGEIKRAGGIEKLTCAADKKTRR